MEEAERDSGDREKNRLTSLHLIGSSCNRRKKNKTTQRPRKKQTTDDRKQSETRKKNRHETARHREGKRTAPQRLAVRDD